MSVTDQLEALTPPTQARSRVVLANTRQVLTLNRETDARTALVRGLAEYVRELSIVAAGGRLCRFVKVLENWAEPESLAQYPSAVIYTTEAGTYDASTLTPMTIKVPGTDVYVRQVAELSQPMTLELWSTDPMERMALVAMLEDALDPLEYMTGLRLELPHYYNQHATYEKLSIAYDDSPETANRRWRWASIQLVGNITQLRVVGKIPNMDIRLEVDVESPGC